MWQNGQTHFKNLAAFAARFLKCADHFGTLCIKGLKYFSYASTNELYAINGVDKVSMIVLGSFI